MSTSQNVAPEQSRTMNILRRAAGTSEIFPPLKAVAEIALKVAELVENFRSNKSEWQEFGAYVQDITATVVESLDKIDSSQQDNRARLESLKTYGNTLDVTVDRIKSEQMQRRKNPFGRYLNDPDMIADMKIRLEVATKLFQLGAISTAMVETTKTLSAVVANNQTLSDIAQDLSATRINTASIENKTSQLVTDSILDKLQRVSGASWDPSRVCLANTRVDLIDEIMAWVSDSDETDSGAQQAVPGEIPGIKIMLLTAVAGAGKTTIAHTVAQRCFKDKRLVSSFFFDREIKRRNTPTALFTTMAADLSGLGKDLAQNIATAIEDDRSLIFAPISRQFEELVLIPCQEHTFTKSMVIVVDALDEAWDDDLFDILQDRARYLPNTVRLFLTSRMRPELDYLCQEEYVRRVDLDITTQANMGDISEYTRHRLSRLAKERKLGDEWPGDALRTQFLAMADGLFLWVATICDYLRRRDNPTAELRRLTEKSNLSSSSAEVRMDRLYANILESFDWSDDSFVSSYGRVMGVAIASQTPMTISAMRELYHIEDLASDFTLQRLSPLLTGMSESEHSRQPVRVLHQSLRDFLVVRSARSPQHAQFHMAEKEKSVELGKLCLEILNRELKVDMPAVGYLSLDGQDQPGVPKIEANTMAEALWYACQFWPDHICDAVGSDHVREALVQFMENKRVIWLEIVASHGICRDTGKLHKWVQVRDQFGSEELRRLIHFFTQEHLDESDTLRVQASDEKFAEACFSLRARLEYDDRLEESLVVAKQAVDLYQRLVMVKWGNHTGSLARSLNKFSVSLSMLGQKEEALAVTREALEIYRRLARDQPATYTPDLANSLANLSADLSDVGQEKEALIAIREALRILRRLAVGQPAAHMPNLARSLRNLSILLSNMERKKEALLAIKEAIGIYRQLCEDRPDIHSSDFAESLANLSIILSDMGKTQEPLLAIQEAVEILRRLAIDRPIAHAPRLASALETLSIDLHSMGQRQEALSAIQEAVVICRRLAVDRPVIHVPDLAHFLNNLSAHLSGMFQYEEALAASQEAVDIYRELTADRLATHAPGLAQALHNIAVCLYDLGRQDEALLAITESIELYRPLTASRPAVFISKLQKALRVLASVHGQLRGFEEAQAARDEAKSLSK